MGGCASKNKHGKEEAYKPVNAPGVQPDFDVIVPESKPAVCNKPPIKLNGTLADGDKREYRNSLVGPGGVILPNQPVVKDETDPSIPYIDASEDELDEDSSPARVKPTLTADVETTVDTSPGVKVPEVPQVAEVVAKVKSVPQVAEVVAEVSKEAEGVKVDAEQKVGDVVQKVRDAIPEVPFGTDTIKPVEVHQTEAAKPEVNFQTPAISEISKFEVEVPKTDIVRDLKNEVKDVPSFEVKDIPNLEFKDVPNVEVKDVPNVEVKDIPNFEVNDVVKEVSNFEVKAEEKYFPNVEVKAEPLIDVKEIASFGVKDVPDLEINGLDEKESGGSLMEEVMKGVGSGFLSKDSYPIDVDAVKEATGNEANKAEAKFEEAQQEASEAATSAFTSGQDFLGEQQEKVLGGLQNGFAEVDDMKNKVNDAAAPVVGGVKDLDMDTAFDALMNSNNLGNFVDIEDSAEFPGFRLAKEEETDVRASPELMEQTTNSVGVLFSPYVMGVGFRVGDKYIMTAYHLIREMLDKMAAQGVTNPEQTLMDNKEIWIQFDYLQFGEYEFDNLTRFRFTSIRYTNPQLNVAILELGEHESKTFPPPLVNFCGIGKRHMVEFVSHDSSPDKRQEMVPLALQPTIKEIQKAGEWCQKQGFPPRGYDGIKDMSMMRFQCAYRRSSCGSPGVVMCDDEIYVVALLTKGYPSFYLDVDERAQLEIPKEFKLVEASSMTDVFVDMKDEETLSELCNNIFGFSVSKQHS